MHRHLAALSGGVWRGSILGSSHYTLYTEISVENFPEYSQQRLCRMCFDQH